MTLNKKILLVLIVFTLVFIWGQSVLPVKSSSAESSAVTEKIIQPIEEALTGKVTVTDSLVRKWAHGVEYCLLGLLMTLFFGRGSYLKIISYCGFAALIDETIQMFGDRGPMISDIWIDCLGASVGFVLGIIILAASAKIKSKNKAGS